MIQYSPTATSQWGVIQYYYSPTTTSQWGGETTSTNGNISMRMIQHPPTATSQWGGDTTSTNGNISISGNTVHCTTSYGNISTASVSASLSVMSVSLSQDCLYFCLHCFCITVQYIKYWICLSVSLVCLFVCLQQTVEYVCLSTCLCLSVFHVSRLFLVFFVAPNYMMLNKQYL